MKKKPRKYFSGGDIASILPMVADLAGNYVNAATYEFNPNGPAYKADWTKGISQGLVGIIPEMIKQQKDTKQRSAYVASATPGNYQQGGPIKTARPVSRGVRPQGYSVYQDVPVPTPQVVTPDPFNPFSTVAPTPVLTTQPLGIGSSSKSKSKDRYREMETGGPLDTKISQSEYTMKSNTKQSGSDSSGRKVLRKGMRDEGSGEITMMQQFLLNKGFYKGKVDGIFGDKTEAAVKEYQKYFNKEAKEPMFYTKDGVNPETIGKGGKKIKEDGIVGDQTRTALMYREKTKLPVKPTPILENVEFPEGERRVKYQTSDSTPNNFPDSPMNYQGGLEMLGLALSVPEAGALITGMATRGAATAGAEVVGNMLNTGTKMNLPEKINVLGNTINNTVTRTGGRYFGPKTPSGYGTRVGYSSGGELQDDVLSNSSFQVKGNPNVTDGNHYPELNANLDHNEVVKDNFVYSTKLKTPAGKPFSFEAAKLEKSTGKAQKVLLSNPNDSTAKNTMMMNEASMKSLARLQETMATSMGLREGRERSFANGGFYDNGGPGDPPYTFVGLTSNKEFPVANITGREWLDFTNPYDPAKGARRRPVTPDTFTGVKLAPNQAAIDLGRDGMYYNPYDRTFSVRNSRGEYVSVTPNPGQFDVSGDNIKDLVGNKTYNVAEHLRFMQSPKLENAGPSGPGLETPSNVLTNPSEPIEELGAFPYPVVSPSPTPAPPVTEAQKRRRPGGGTKPTTPTKAPTTWDNLLAAVKQNKPAPYDPNAMPSEVDVLSQLGPATNITRPDDRLSRLGPLQAPTEDSKSMSMEAVAPGTAPGNIFAGTDPKFTVGDGLQALTVLSKFGQLQGGAEVERPYYDNTSITKENFDPSNALAKSSSNFQQGLNTLQNSSINQNRSFLNRMYASKLDQDSDILTKYNQMNQSARSQYEARTADQRRYNITQTVGTNDINARNRAAYKEAVDVALNSVGNLGKGLNEKRTAYDSLAVLQKMYPDVYARIMAEQQKTQKSNGG